jgi:5'-nucleotidase
METIGIMKSKLLLLISLILLSQNFVYTQSTNSHWLKKVLITNDDGIDDPKIIELARAFSKIAETVVVAPIGDRSSSSHYLSVFSKYSLNVEHRKIDEKITAYGVDGYPADCVFLALNGLLKDSPPDLVISGINGGPNLGFDWIASGTIGAARIAAFWGVPSIAVSGLKEGIPGSLEFITEWLVRLAQSKIVSELKPKQYLTISFPRIPPSEIKGIKVSKRADILLEFEMSKISKEKSHNGTEVWQLNPPKQVLTFDKNSDAAYYNAGYIVIVPMIADEHDNILLNFINDNLKMLPDLNK